MRSLLILLLLSGGCAPLVDAQMNLIDQARKGVALAAEAQADGRIVQEELARLRRLRLDEAFDADVLAQPALSAPWVIEHRQAYAAGLAALSDAALTARLADDARVANLAATDAALERARRLMQIQLRWSDLLTAPPGAAAR